MTSCCQMTTFQTRNSQQTRALARAAAQQQPQQQPASLSMLACHPGPVP